MSYPKRIHTLIVEDEPDTVSDYKEKFIHLGKAFDLAPPEFARSYQDADARLRGAGVFHLLVLDLGLPVANRQPPEEGLEPGKQLLVQAARRDDYPIPCVLVVSARLGLAKLPELTDRLHRDFWYGRAVNKGIEVSDELHRALQRANEYCDVGIHVRPGRVRWVRPLGPREDDLLRRCVLSQPECIGVDVEWWSSEDGISSTRDPFYGGSTNVLMGRFLLGEGRGGSRPSFFKLEPAGDELRAERDTALMNQKLRYVKKCWSGWSQTRGLLVTQSVTESRPVSLEEFLSREPATVLPAVQGIVADICEQLEFLGAATEDDVEVRSLLWRSHRRETIEAGLGEDSPRKRKVLQVFDHLMSSRQRAWVRTRRCGHGDLNASNVAVDLHGSAPHAYIFDAAGIGEGSCVRDLAFLEVTTLLFAPGDGSGTSTVRACSRFYANDVAVPPREDGLPPSAQQNLDALLAEIRRRAVEMSTAAVYALAVFDAALIELGGLTLQRSRNKISTPAEAVELSCLVAEWLCRIAPEYVGAHEGGVDLEGT